MRNLIRTALFFALNALTFSGLAVFAQSETDLSGSYYLNRSRSENVQEVVESAILGNNISAANRRDLENRLTPPKIVAISISGNRVTLSTSTAPDPLIFTADGRTKTSTGTDGTKFSFRASLRSNRLTISSSRGDFDYELTYTSVENGSAMRVTRRFTTSYLTQTVFADSHYDKTGGYAQVSTTGSTDPDNNTSSSNSNSGDDGSSSSSSDTDSSQPSIRTAGNGEFTVPKGTVLTGTLDNRVSTKDSQDNDRFSITIGSPSEFGGAVIEGYLSNVKSTGKITGRSSFTMNFDTIRLADGSQYDFAGVLQTVTDASGKIIKVGTEGDAKGGSKTKDTVKRTGIGAGIGAIIGGIIGGGTGAAIGAAIGGTAGVGTVIAGGRGDLVLDQGAAITVESTSPNK